MHSEKHNRRSKHNDYGHFLLVCVRTWIVSKEKFNSYWRNKNHYIVNEFLVQVENTPFYHSLLTWTVLIENTAHFAPLLHRLVAQ